MDLQYLVAQLADNASRIQKLAGDVSDDQARWKPAPGSWSILEVVNHLLDEEREDFRVRLEITLHQSGRPWPPIDPEGWVTARHYNQRDFQASLAAFLSEREASLGWLRGLVSPDWQAVYVAPFGEIRAGDLFASWVAHDLLHMRQFVELLWAYTVAQAKPYRVQYAGTW